MGYIAFSWKWLYVLSVALFLDVVWFCWAFLVLCGSFRRKLPKSRYLRDFNALIQSKKTRYLTLTYMAPFNHY